MLPLTSLHTHTHTHTQRPKGIHPHTWALPPHVGCGQLVLGPGLYNGRDAGHKAEGAWLNCRDPNKESARETARCTRTSPHCCNRRRVTRTALRWGTAWWPTPAAGKEKTSISRLRSVWRQQTDAALSSGLFCQFVHKGVRLLWTPCYIS